MQEAKSEPVKSKIHPWRDGIMLGGMVLLITVFCNSVMYYYASQGMLKEIQETLFHVARTAAVMTNGDVHQTLTDPAQKGSEDYLARMNAIRLPYAVSIFLSLILSILVMLVIKQIRQGHSERWVARQNQLEALKTFQAHIKEVSSGVSDISFKIDGKTAQIAGMAKTSAEKMLTARSVIQGSTDKYQSISDATIGLMDVIQTLSGVIAGHTQSAIDGMEKIKETKHSSQELMDATKNISHVAAIINEITERTELLALNASIEAARAGAAGKGFAVVADEVKMLASQTKQSTEQIVKYIDAMKRAAESTVHSVDSGKDFITKIDEMSQKTQAMILEQKDMIGYITDDIKDVTQRTSVINEMVDAISVIAENISGQTGTMHKVVHSLHEQNTALSEEVSRFIKTM